MTADPSNPTPSPHPLDVCHCGDYRRQHPNGGPSALNWDNPKGVEPCMKFRLAKPADKPSAEERSGQEKLRIRLEMRKP